MEIAPNADWSPFEDTFSFPLKNLTTGSTDLIRIESFEDVYAVQAEISRRNAHKIFCDNKDSNGDRVRRASYQVLVIN